MTRQRMIPVLIVLGLMLLVPFSSAAQSNASIRVIHTSPDAPAVDVYLNGERVIAGLGFTQASLYLPVPLDSQQLQVFPTGSTPDDNPVLETTVDLEAAQSYTVLAINELANLEALVLTDDPAPPVDGRAMVRLLHAAVGEPAVTIGTQEGSLSFENIAFRESTDYTAVDAGTYQFDVTTGEVPEPVLTSDPIALEAGQTYTIAAMGQVPNNTFQVVAYRDTAQSTGEVTMSIPGMPNTGGGGMSGSQSGIMGLQWSLVASASLLLFLGIAWAVWTVKRA